MRFYCISTARTHRQSTTAIQLFSVVVVVVHQLNCAKNRNYLSEKNDSAVVAQINVKCAVDVVFFRMDRIGGLVDGSWDRIGSVSTHNWMLLKMNKADEAQ